MQVEREVLGTEAEELVQHHLAEGHVVAIVSGAVSLVAITSRRGILWTGEKKCIPSTWPGRRQPAAISPMGIEDVLLAKTHSSEVTPSVSASTRRLSSRSSKTASITRSARPKPV